MIKAIILFAGLFFLSCFIPKKTNCEYNGNNHYNIPAKIVSKDGGSGVTDLTLPPSES